MRAFVSAGDGDSTSPRVLAKRPRVMPTRQRGLVTGLRPLVFWLALAGTITSAGALVLAAAVTAAPLPAAPQAAACSRACPTPPPPSQTIDISVNPPHGPAGDSFSVDYRILPTCSDTVEFFFAGQLAATGAFGSDCNAFATLTPPGGSAPGAYTVSAISCPGGGTCDQSTRATTTYTIDPAATPTPTVGPTPTPKPTPTANPTPKPTPRPTPTP